MTYLINLLTYTTVLLGLICLIIGYLVWRVNDLKHENQKLRNANAEMALCFCHYKANTKSRLKLAHFRCIRCGRFIPQGKENWADDNEPLCGEHWNAWVNREVKK